MARQNYIWEYLQGKRTGRAANRFEREMLSDPFLYESIEGLEAVEGVHEEIVNKLEKQLRYPLKRKRLFVYRWIMAASFVLMVGIAVTLLYREVGKEQLSLVADHKNADVNSSEINTDSLQMASIPLEENRKDSVIFSMREAKVKVRMGGDKQLQRTAGKDEQEREKKIHKIDNKAEIAQKVATIAEDTERLDMDNYRVGAAKPRKELKMDTSRWDEIVVIGMGKRNKNTFTGSAGVKKTVEQETDTVKSARKIKRERRVKSKFEKERLTVDKKYVKEDRMIHLEWQKKFDHYVLDSLRYPEDARLEKIEGEVRLAVRLNRKGLPARIKLLQRLSSSCDREAIRLVEDYPGQWENTEKEILLTIPFRLPANK